jgi:SAM-dependent methyltransferase
MMQSRHNPDWPADLGPSWPELGWVPAPRYLLRRRRVLARLNALDRDRLLEIGCGAGALLHELAAMGFDGEGLDASAQAVEVAARIAATAVRPVAIHAAPQPGWGHRFGTLVAMEVLEHIEDDVGALAGWREWLQPGGALVLSVPAHVQSWSAADEWAGHVRRYDEADLRRVLVAAGYTLESIECYGFPLGNLLDVFSRRGYARAVIRRADGSPDRQANNDRSGVDRGAALRSFGLVSSLPGRAALAIAYLLQAMFSRTRFGTGFIVVARRT